MAHQKKILKPGLIPSGDGLVKKSSPERLTLFRNNFRRRKMAKKRYAVCGVSSRGLYQYIKQIVENFKDHAELVALLDIDPLRFQICYEDYPSTKNVPGYMPDEFDKMIEETRPDALIITSMDCTHVTYLVKGLEKGLDVITEKPMCTNTEDCLKVLEAEEKSKGKVIYTFNYRYNPVHRKVKELVLEGAVGRVTHVDLTWYIDIRHGSSYFNRWNRMRENSGSLSIHKASHHFDLVNWWVDGAPMQVHAFGALNHYGPKGEFNPSVKDGRHCDQCKERRHCAYRSRWETRNAVYMPDDDHINAFFQQRKLFTEYRPDMCIFDSQINIHDTLVANVRFNNGALLNYSANFSTPYEGYHLAINGTRGRLETTEFGGSGGAALPNINEGGVQYIDLYPIFEGRQRIHVPKGVGGHGGGDPVILEDIFMGEDPDRKYSILAKSVDGLRAIGCGDAVWNSIMQNNVQDLSSFMK